jgi:tetratricopeptide (TPR) repeat protein
MSVAKFVLSFAMSISTTSALYATNIDDKTASDINKFKQACERTKSHFGAKSPYYAKSLYELGSAYSNNGYFPESEKSVRESLTILESLPPGEVFDLDLAEVRGLLGRILDIRKKYDEAQPLLIQAIDVQLRMEPKDDNVMFDCLQSLADVYEKKGDLPNAEKYYRMVMDKVFYRNDNLEARKRRNVDATIALANVLFEEGRKGEARNVADKASDMMRRGGRSYNDFSLRLGELYAVLNDHNKEEQLYKTQLSYYETAKVSHRWDIEAYSVAAKYLTHLLVSEGRDEEAVQLADRLIGFLKHAGGVPQLSDYETLTQAATASARLKHFVRAEEFMDKAMSIATHHDMQLRASTAYLRGTISSDAHNYQAAEKSFLQAKDLYSKIRGAEPQVALCLKQVGQLSIAEKKISQANSYFEQAAKVQRARYGPDSKEVMDFLQSIGDYCKVVEPKLANDYYGQAQKIRTKLAPSKSLVAH